MIKNLLNADEEIAVKPEKAPETVSLFGAEAAAPDSVEVAPGISVAPDLFLGERVPEASDAVSVEPETVSIIIDRKSAGAGVQSYLFEDPVRPASDTAETETPTIIVADRRRVADPSEFPPDPPAISFKPPSKAEVIRRSGLAWSAGIVFFGSVVFMLILGWLADLLLGSSPIGIVGGVIIGSIIGFVQLFRISSQILKQ